MVMITGATGFLGAHVLYQLAARGIAIKALYRDRNKIAHVRRIFGYYTDDISALWNRINWIECDILDYYSLRDHMHGVKELYHTAGMISFNNRDRRKLNQINIQGTANVVNACLEQGIEKLCHVSSIATLGEFDGSEFIDENLIWNPGPSASAYATSKLKGEMEVWRGIHEGLKAVIVNPSVIIGPGMWMGSAGNLLDRIRMGLKYYPEGSTGYVDVRDVATAMIRLTEGNHFNERYIINAENLFNRILLNHIADAMQRPRPVHPITPLLMTVSACVESIRSAISGNVPRVTRKALEISDEKLAYSNKKIRDAVAMDFIPIEDSVRFSIALFMADTASLN